MHARSLLENLRTIPGVKYIFYIYDSTNPIEEMGIDIEVDYEIVRTPAIKHSIDRPQDFFKVAKVIWHRYAPLKAYDIDVFVQFDFMLGLPHWRTVRKVLIAYDLIPLIFPNEYLPSPLYALKNASGLKNKIKKPLRAAYYRFRYRLHYREFSRADMNLSISDSTAKSLVKYLRVKPERITTIPLAPVVSSKEPQRIPKLSGLSKPFFFYIGGTDSRKQVQDLVDSYNTLRESGDRVTLVLAGKEFDGVADIPSDIIRQSVSSSPYGQDIICIGYVSDEQKQWLYKNAVAFVYPTLYEGFGLPVVEAMHSSCPVISYNNSSIPEVAGQAAILVENNNVAELSKAMHSLLTNDNLRSKLIQDGRAQSSIFSWENYMKKFYYSIFATTKDL